MCVNMWGPLVQKKLTIADPSRDVFNVADPRHDIVVSQLVTVILQVEPASLLGCPGQEVRTDQR